jgi:uncharacterized protein (DUF983 family)
MSVRSVLQPPAAGSAVMCPHCSAGIPADSFEYPYWTAARRDMSAWCPKCHIRVTISSKSWRQASGLPNLATP